MKIGIAGTGRMGSAMAQRLLSTGNTVSVWNRTHAKTKPLEAAGAAVTATCRELAENSDLVLSLLTDGAAVENTYCGTAGLLSGDVRGRIFVEMSTIRPEVQERLAARVEATGARLIDCPVGGSTGPARDGKLIGFVGGDADALEAARPILAQLCRRIEHLGPVGSGTRMKLAINLPLLVYWQALGEALRLIEPLDLDPVRVVDILADTSGGPNVLKVRGPTVAAALRGEEVSPVTFDIDSIRKDLRTMIEEGHALGAELPLTARALACYDELSAAGLGDRDASALPARFLRNQGKTT